MPLRLQPIWTHSFNNYVLAAPWTSSVLGSRERVNLTGSFPIVPTVSTLFPRCSLGFPNLVSLVSLFPDGSDPSSSSHHTTTDEPCRPSPLKLFLVSLVPMCFCGTYHFQSCILASFYNSDYSKYSWTGIISHSSFNLCCLAWCLAAVWGWREVLWTDGGNAIRPPGPVASLLISSSFLFSFIVTNITTKCKKMSIARDVELLA